MLATQVQGQTKNDLPKQSASQLTVASSGQYEFSAPAPSGFRFSAAAVCWKYANKDSAFGRNFQTEVSA
jgi:hypothetical protein